MGTAGSIRFSSANFSVIESAGTAAITIQRVGGDNGAVNVLFITDDGTAIAGLDYVDTTSVVSWADNDDNPRTVLVPIIDDGIGEPTKTVVLMLLNPTGGATLGSPSTATLTIVDDDDPPPPPPPSGGDCTADEETLCLLDDRFEIKVDWSTIQGISGQGQAVELTPDTGYFWFFNQNNVEMVIKVRNACVPPFNRFWVFAGGLTNLEIEITVKDTKTGAEKTYNNPPSTPFKPITDTSAFATCP